MSHAPKIIVLTTDAVLTTVLLEDAKQYPETIEIVKDLPETTGLFDILVVPASYFLSPIFCHSKSIVLVYGALCFLPFCYAKNCYDFIKEPWDLCEIVFKARKVMTTKTSIHPLLPIVIKNKQLICDKTKIALTAREEALLSCLSRNYGQVVTREHLSVFIAPVYRKNSSEMLSRRVDIHITRLRKKLLAFCNLPLFPAIKTVYAQGYTLVIENCE